MPGENGRLEEDKAPQEESPDERVVSEAEPARKKDDSLATRLRKITQEVRRKEEEEREERARADREEARKVIASIEESAIEEAMAGKNHLLVMDVTYKDARPKINRKGCELDSSSLTGACKLVWDYCEQEGLEPKLIGRWTSIQLNIHRVDFSIMISW